MVQLPLVKKKKNVLVSGDFSLVTILTNKLIHLAVQITVLTAWPGCGGATQRRFTGSTISYLVGKMDLHDTF